jgi:hypothetical protein
VVQLPLETSASTSTNDLHEWELSCRKIPNQYQPEDKSDTHSIQPRPRIRTSCRLHNLIASSQLSHTAKTLLLTPHSIDESNVILINYSLLQSLNLGRTNSYILACYHPVLHLPAHVQIKRTIATPQLSNSHSQLRKLKGQRLTHRPSTSCALQQEPTPASQATRNKSILLAHTRVTARIARVQPQRP